jgi:hypothetical protein
MNVMDSSTADILREFASQPSPDSSDCNNQDAKPRSIYPSKEHGQLKNNYCDLNPHVRIHPTEMQRYIHNLMKSNEDSDEPMAVTAFEGEKEEGEGAAVSAFLANMESCAEIAGEEPSNKKFKSNPADGMFCAPIGLSGALDEDKGVSASQSHRGNAASSATKSDGSVKANGKPSSKNKKNRPASSNSSDSKGDNFKNVDVLHETTLIARFLTQTECAAYLRATPEAVSYHCSKGGGVCNGLIIRPSKPSESDEPLQYGLFAGADRHRPKERPQLNKESVKILKDWLMSPEHIENPYPNQLEFNELAKKTGLDKTQLKHWFNNARKRILKPYLKDGNSSAADGAKGKKKRIRKSEDLDGDAVSRALRNAAAAMSQTSNSAVASDVMARNPFIQNDGPALTESDEIPRALSSVLNQSMCMDIGRPDSAFNAFRNHAFGNSALGRDSLFGHPTGLSAMGLNNDQTGGMIGSFSSANPFGASQLNGLSGRGNNSTSLDMPGRVANGGSLFGNNDPEDFDPSRENDRSNALFKQQVAAMAMDEANIAFQDTEAAYSRAKELYSRSVYERPEEEDPMVKEANAVAKRCQSVAVFKLKVSQRANEEAAKAYSKYQLQGGCGLDGNFDGGGF